MNHNFEDFGLGVRSADPAKITEAGMRIYPLSPPHVQHDEAWAGVRPARIAKRFSVHKEWQKLPDDGFQWHKYGQKLLMDNSISRAYYRCARKAAGCPARKTVDFPTDTGKSLRVIYHEVHDHVGADGKAPEDSPQQKLGSDGDDCHQTGSEVTSLDSLSGSPPGSGLFSFIAEGSAEASSSAQKAREPRSEVLGETEAGDKCTTPDMSLERRSSVVCHPAPDVAPLVRGLPSENCLGRTQTLPLLPSESHQASAAFDGACLLQKSSGSGNMLSRMRGIEKHYLEGMPSCFRIFLPYPQQKSEPFSHPYSLISSGSALMQSKDSSVQFHASDVSFHVGGKREGETIKDQVPTCKSLKTGFEGPRKLQRASYINLELTL